MLSLVHVVKHHQTQLIQIVCQRQPRYLDAISQLVYKTMVHTRQDLELPTQLMEFNKVLFSRQIFRLLEIQLTLPYLIIRKILLFPLRD